MPIIDIDRIPGLSDPITLRLRGKDYTCPGFSKELLDQVSALAEQEVEGDSTSFHEVASKQLALIFNETPEEFYKCDARELAVSVTRVMEVMSKAGEAKPSFKRKKN